MDKQRLNKVINSIEWDNWKDEENPKVKYFSVPTVLINKLNWLREFLNETETDDKETYLSTLDEVEDYIEAFRDESEKMEAE